MFGIRGLDGFGLAHAMPGIIALAFGLTVVLLQKGTRGPFHAAALIRHHTRGWLHRHPNAASIIGLGRSTRDFHVVDLCRIDCSILVGEFRRSEDCEAGSVAAALRTRTGNIYTGICIEPAYKLV